MDSKRKHVVAFGFAVVRGLILMLVLGASLRMYGATFTATLDRDTIKFGEQATLSLTISGGSPSVEPTLPKIPNLQSGQIGTSQNMMINNGQVTSTISYNFMLSPTQTGDFQIPVLTVEVNGEKLASQPLQLKVLRPDAPPPAGANAATQLAFLRLTLPKTNMYVGEMFVARL